MLRSINLIKGAFKPSVLFKPTRSHFCHRLAQQRCTPLVCSLARSIHLQTPLRRNEANVDRSLLTLDREIRKTGRINRREIEEILEDIRDMKKATSSQSLMIIRCCGELVPAETPENRTKLVQEVWKTMESLNVPVDISHFNALLKVYLENEHKFDPTEFLQELSNKGIEPNRVTFQRLIAHYCQQGNIDGASTILQHMKDKQLPINEHVFNALILGHAHANDMQSAEGMLSVMRQAGLEPVDDTYLAVLSGYAKHGDIASIHRICKECEEKEIFLVDRDFLNLIYILATNNKGELVDELIPYLRKLSGFNQEATNIILRLVNAEKEDVGFKVLQQMIRGMRNEEYVPSGSFFVGQMVLASRPSSTIIKYCKELADTGMNKYALVRACEVALSGKKFEIASDLLEALKESGFPIRQHYFWPFFAGNRTEKELYDGLKTMTFLGVPVSAETMREYVVPAVLEAGKKGATVDATLEILSANTRIPVFRIAPHVVQHLLTKNNMVFAAKVAAKYKTPVSGPQLRRSLVQSYLFTKDANSLSQMLMIAGSEQDYDPREVAGQLLLDITEASPRNDRVTSLKPLLDVFIKDGVGISNSTAELLQNILGEALTPQITDSISKLVSGDLIRKSQPVVQDEITPEDMERVEEENKRLNRPPNKGFQKVLLVHYAKQKNVEKAEALRLEMQKQGFSFGPNLLTHLLELYSETNQLEKAREVYSSLTAHHEYSINGYRFMKYLVLLATSGCHDEVLANIANAKKEADVTPGFGQNGQVWRLLNVYGEQGKTEEVKTLLNKLEESGLAEMNNVVLGPLIKSYVVRDDLEGAMSEFERCVNEYKASPWKNELFCRFIKAEDADQLQRVLDLSTKLYGEVNSLYDLVFAFIDCGKIRQAKKILDTPGLKALHSRLGYICQKYLEDNRIEDLENLVRVTKDVFDIDRNSMYQHLLTAYIKQGDPDKALSVWTSLQEENVQPSPELLKTLADFLKKKDKAVPFVYNEGKQKKDKASTSTVKKSEQSDGSPTKAFRNALKNKNLDEALSFYSKLPQDSIHSIPFRDRGQLAHLLLKADRLNDALRLTEDLASTGNYPQPPTLRGIVKRLQESGDIERLTSLSKQLPLKVAKLVRTESAIAYAATQAGKGEEHFTNIIKEAVESSAGGARTLPTVALMKLLEAKPELVAKFEELGAGSIGKVRGVNPAVWWHYMKKKDFTNSRNILNERVEPTENVFIAEIVTQAKDNKDLELATELWTMLKGRELVANVKARAAGCLVDVLRLHGDLTRAVDTLKAAVKDIPLDEFRHDELVALKTDVENANQEFPFQLPEESAERRRRRRKNDASSSSDSDSDSD